jgi:hypothetical protein
MDQAVQMEQWFAWTFMITALVMCFSWLIFGRLVMARIEKKITQAGEPRPCPWDGPGARIMWYAWALGFPIGRLNRLDDPLIDVALVRRYSSRRDRIIAIIMLSTTWALVALVVIATVIFDL